MHTGSAVLHITTPVLLRIYRWGGLVSIAGIAFALGGAWRPNPLRWYAQPVLPACYCFGLRRQPVNESLAEHGSKMIVCRKCILTNSAADLILSGNDDIDPQGNYDYHAHAQVYLGGADPLGSQGYASAVKKILPALRRGPRSQQLAGVFVSGWIFQDETEQKNSWRGRNERGGTGKNRDGAGRRGRLERGGSRALGRSRSSLPVRPSLRASARRTSRSLTLPRVCGLTSASSRWTPIFFLRKRTN